VDLATYEEEIPASANDPDLERMRRAIFQLDDGYREPLVLQVLLGHSTREIAELTGLTEATVLTRLHRARNRLKQALSMPDDSTRRDGGTT
jgi:RNA polymerase sigma-70 factor (ECF subfamily)